MKPNESSAVLNQRNLSRNSCDDFPTPQWGTRALVKYIIGENNLNNRTVLEPCAGRGYISNTLKEYGAIVTEQDKFYYGKDYPLIDFFDYDGTEIFDFIVTNPPFNIADKFVSKAMNFSRNIFILERLNFLEGKKRFDNIFSMTPPSIVAPFVERLPMVYGRVDRKASTATSYAWFCWLNDRIGKTQCLWIPPCRKELEKDDDYIPH